MKCVLATLSFISHEHQKHARKNSLGIHETPAIIGKNLAQLRSSSFGSRSRDDGNPSVNVKASAQESSDVTSVHMSDDVTGARSETSSAGDEQCGGCRIHCPRGGRR